MNAIEKRPRNCLYCGDSFIPKQKNSKCCSRLHSQAYNKVGRARISTYQPRPDIGSQPQCCQDWRNADPSNQTRTVCPQHQVAHKIGLEDRYWQSSWQQFKDTYSQAWGDAGYTIHGGASE